MIIKNVTGVTAVTTKNKYLMEMGSSGARRGRRAQGLDPRKRGYIGYIGYITENAGKICNRGGYIGGYKKSSSHTGVPEMTELGVYNAAEWLTRELPDDGYEDRLRTAKRLKEYAQLTGPAPSPQATNHVTCRFERLHRTLWKGQQWAVTAYGLECRDGRYCIAKDRLWENEDSYGWLRHMAGKTWVHLLDFAEALRVARKFHEGST